ncbi:MAG: DUF3108 domain-containing protein [Desulfococcaceae bacterium]|jgi:hypothetical protein|nr:DUF3108 domain-containing protein [Desulfococcaceae bacterium]
MKCKNEGNDIDIMPAASVLIKIIHIALFILFVFLFPGTGTASDPTVSPPLSHPFYPGEKLTFSLRWGIIHAGEATLEVLPLETGNGRVMYHFVMTAETNAFIDTFYKVRDRIDAFADSGMTRSCLYKKKQREGKSKRDITVVFDWEKKEARYSNRGKSKPPVSLMPGAFDPLSAFYFARLTDFSKQKILMRPVCDGKRIVMGEVRVKKRETVKIGEKSYDTFLLEPNLKDVKGVFEKSKDASIQLWITADERRIPVKIASKVVVGSFVGELLSCTYGSEPEKSAPSAEEMPKRKNTDESGNRQGAVEQH